MGTTTHVMLDIETVSKQNTAAILSIGAVAFDPNDPDTLAEDGDKFHVRCDLTDQELFKLTIDGNTVEWWLKPSLDAARKQLQEMEPVDIRSALAGLTEWMDALPGEDVAVWGNGSTFDNAIVLHAYRRTGVQMPDKWTYKSDRCYRTMKRIRGCPAPIDYGTAHGALDDAIAQANHLKVIVALAGMQVD